MNFHFSAPPLRSSEFPTCFGRVWIDPGKGLDCSRQHLRPSAKLVCKAGLKPAYRGPLSGRLQVLDKLAFGLPGVELQARHRHPRDSRL